MSTNEEIKKENSSVVMEYINDSNIDLHFAFEDCGFKREQIDIEYILANMYRCPHCLMWSEKM